MRHEYLVSYRLIWTVDGSEYGLKHPFRADSTLAESVIADNKKQAMNQVIAMKKQTYGDDTTCLILAVTDLGEVDATECFNSLRRDYENEAHLEYNCDTSEYNIKRGFVNFCDKRGSGKTTELIKLANAAFENGHKVIVIVPEDRMSQFYYEKGLHAVIPVITFEQYEQYHYKNYEVYIDEAEAVLNKVFNNNVKVITTNAEKVFTVRK